MHVRSALSSADNGQTTGLTIFYCSVLFLIMKTSSQNISITLLRTFARKSSNIDFFSETFSTLRLWVTHVKKVKKKLGITEFVSEILCSKDHPKSEKLGFVTAYG